MCEKSSLKILESDIPQLRDPCVLFDKGVYYVYGTGWNCYRNATGSLETGWEGPFSVVSMPAGHESEGGCHWAPEVHRYGDALYMFTTYLSNKTGRRGCTVLKAENPLGPFVEISDGPVTPRDWDAIDATLYVDENGRPWMVFVHEWTSTDDGVGRMAAARLSDDLTRLVSEPVELFRADDPSWSSNRVTDGCWMRRTARGSLLMIWSNFADDGYCVGVARSLTGLVTGPWIQENERLYAKSMGAPYDGGHGMIFTHTDGQLYLSLHSPNNASAGRPEKPVFIPIRETDDSLVWER